jgi:hypothetical protein
LLAFVFLQIFGCIFNEKNLEIDGKGLSPYSQAPNHDPTQRLRGNPISLNPLLYNNIIIYISFSA